MYDFFWLWEKTPPKEKGVGSPSHGFHRDVFHGWFTYTSTRVDIPRNGGTKMTLLFSSWVIKEPDLIRDKIH